MFCEFQVCARRLSYKARTYFVSVLAEKTGRAGHVFT